MRQKELRIALVCYGGISLAVYMHGITKEIWRLTCASRSFHANVAPKGGSQGVYRQLLEDIGKRTELKVRVLPDIIAGASAGGINGVFLAQALATGQSLEPLTDLWLECADIDVLLDPDARPMHWFSKIWAQPLVWLMLSRPGGTVERTVSKDARSEVKTKLSRLIRARWFAPPFSGYGFSKLLYDAQEAMSSVPPGPRLIPIGQPLDLFVTVTDFHGHLERLRLHSPAEVIETEHRLTIGFKYIRGKDNQLADPAELTFAARATASFPGAFPPFNVAEIDALMTKKRRTWNGRDRFLRRVFPQQTLGRSAEEAVLIDGSVLANAPFSQAIAALKSRPSYHEVDRRFVYIDPKPDRGSGFDEAREKDSRGHRLPGFFSTIFGAISDIPREQPIRDNLESIEMRSTRINRMRQITESLRTEVEDDISTLFSRTWLFDSPTPQRLSAWRNKAQDKAAKLAGFTYAAYGQLKMSGIVEDIVDTLRRAHPEGNLLFHQRLRDSIWFELRSKGLDRLSDDKGGATDTAIQFFKEQDLGFRIRRLKFLARRLSQDISARGTAPNAALVTLHDTIYSCLAQYLDRESGANLGDDIGEIAKTAIDRPARALKELAKRRNLRNADRIVDEQLAISLSLLPQNERRSMMLAYLGFPFYDIATLPLLQGEGQNEFDPIKVDRISPDDAPSIRSGGAEATLKGIEFNSFGAFFSRAYRENDYLWGRLHGAERMIDLLISTCGDGNAFEPKEISEYKHRIFVAILDEEDGHLEADPKLIPQLRGELEKNYANASG